MYTFEILSLISWPILIAVSFFLAVMFIKRYEKKNNLQDQK